jgi:hypothetical protein
VGPLKKSLLGEKTESDCGWKLKLGADGRRDGERIELVKEEEEALVLLG